MKDERYLFYQDSREKKNIARSARNKRTHNGKRGGVKFPSDYMTKKEIEKMNGETKSYRLNEPMPWKEFKQMPDDIKKMYVLLLREKFRGSDAKIAEMMGVTRPAACKEFLRLKITPGRGNRLKGFDAQGWNTWCNGNSVVEDQTEQPTPEANTIPEEPEVAMEQSSEIPRREPAAKAIPDSGNMVFEGRTEDILKTVEALLGGAVVHISITWDAIIV